MSGHVFGGPDTEVKLGCLRDYLAAYSIALKNTGFRTLYIDAFAGSGSRTEVRPHLPLLQDAGAQSEIVTTPGSAAIALATEPPLGDMFFIEQDAGRRAELACVRARHPDRTIHILDGDANERVREICARTPWRGGGANRRGVRGVIFLDPYGMEVDWTTVEAIARTQALDCWYFFPLSGLYRNAPHDPRHLDAGKQAKLDRVLGERAWRDRWWAGGEPDMGDLFGDPVMETRRASVNAIETYVSERLGSVFKGGVLAPLRLHHRNGPPMASLFFAIANPHPKAAPVARRIAAHILNSGRSSQRRPR